MSRNNSSFLLLAVCWFDRQWWCYYHVTCARRLAESSEEVRVRHTVPPTFIDEDCFHSKYLCNVFRAGVSIHHSRLCRFRLPRCLGGYSGEWLAGWLADYLHRHVCVHPYLQTVCRGGGGATAAAATRTLEPSCESRRVRRKRRPGREKEWKKSL